MLLFILLFGEIDISKEALLSQAVSFTIISTYRNMNMTFNLSTIDEQEKLKKFVSFLKMFEN